MLDLFKILYMFYGKQSIETNEFVSVRKIIENTSKLHLVFIETFYKFYRLQQITKYSK